MRLIELDASAWRSPLDLHDALKAALGSPQWHGSNMNAWIDSIVWGQINEVEPPYVIRISGVSQCPNSVRDEIALFAECVESGLLDQMRRTGKMVYIAIITANLH